MASSAQLILLIHYSDVIISAMASQTTGVSIVYSNACSGVDQRKHQSSASLTFLGEFTGDQWISRTKGQQREKMFPFDDVIMSCTLLQAIHITDQNRNVATNSAKINLAVIFHAHSLLTVVTGQMDDSLNCVTNFISKRTELMLPMVKSKMKYTSSTHVNVIHVMIIPNRHIYIYIYIYIYISMG